MNNYMTIIDNLYKMENILNTQFTKTETRRNLISQSLNKLNLLLKKPSHFSSH